MLRKLYCIGLLSLVSSSLGCVLCCSPDDCNYAAYGGRWQRDDMSGGRVGSAFAEAGYDSLGEIIDDQPAAEPAVEPAAEPQRRAGDDQLRPASFDEVSTYVE